MGCSSVLVILAAVAFAEVIAQADVSSNYARVATNADVIRRNDTDGLNGAPVTPEAINGTDYEDFDDLEEEEEGLARHGSSDSGAVMKYVNGLVSLLALMYRFGDKAGWQRRKGGAFEPRYSPDAATQKFKTDQQRQPISNYPPYNPLTANAAESYAGKTSYDADAAMYKAPESDGQSAWTAPGHDYPVYSGAEAAMPSHEWRPQPWRAPDEHHAPGPDYADYPGGGGHLQHHVEDEDRVNKRPYSYYFLGRKLWYIPLIFSVYFIIYVAALVLKSIARHKIQFPEKLWDLNDHHYKHRRLDDATNAVVTAKYKFM